MVLPGWLMLMSMIHSQAMEEHRVRQVKIVEALEAEKKKINNELKEMQRRRAVRENQPPRNGQICVSRLS